MGGMDRQDTAFYLPEKKWNLGEKKKSTGRLTPQMIKTALVALRNKCSQWLLLGNHSSTACLQALLSDSKRHGRTRTPSRAALAFEWGLIRSQVSQETSAFLEGKRGYWGTTLSIPSCKPAFQGLYRITFKAPQSPQSHLETYWIQ